MVPLCFEPGPLRTTGQKSSNCSLERNKGVTVIQAEKTKAHKQDDLLYNVLKQC